MKKAIIIGVIVLVAAIGGYFIYQFKQARYEFATVTRGSIVREVLARGNVQSPTTISLNFQNAGKLVFLNADVGKNVNAGAMLAKQDSAILAAQLQQAQANASAQAARLDELRTGSTPETIAVSQTALATARQSLTNTYSGVTNVLDDVYAKSNDAVRNQLAALFSTPEGNNPQLTFSVSDSQVLNNVQTMRILAGANLNTWQTELVSVTANSSVSTLDAALQNAISHLSPIRILMNNAITALTITNETSLSASALATYKTSVTTGLNEVNAAIAEVNATQQNIASEKAAVAQAQAQLNLIVASATPQAIQAQQAQVIQAQASIAMIQAQITQTVLTAPTDGIVTKTSGHIGENVTPDMAIVSFTPKSVLEIKLNVSEDNIVGVQVGQPVRITLSAFPSGTEWRGKVVSIDPAQTITGGAVYYQTTILFDKLDLNVKPGMTANVQIETGSNSNTLIVPTSAVQMKGSSTFVQIYQNGKVTNQNVTTGLKGRDGMIEIASGLDEGQKVVTGNR